MPDDSLDDALARALSGDRAALQTLIAGLAPIVQARVARALTRRGGRAGRDPRQELRDMVHEVFIVLLEDDARALRGWQKDRGLSLQNFVGLVAERQVARILRTGRRSPWKDEPTDDIDLESHVGATDAPLERIASRELLAAMLDRLREELSPRMLHVFQALWVHEVPVTTLCEETGMTPNAVYMARSRIAKRAREIAEELLAFAPTAPTPSRAT